eukprot:1953218-Amphidinium_carterae.1
MADYVKLSQNLWWCLQDLPVWQIRVEKSPWNVNSGKLPLAPHHNVQEAPKCRNVQVFGRRQTVVWYEVSA